jgi:phage terminase large subunit GpA-like protein
MLIDSGYRAPEVYEFCRRFPPDQVMPSKGRDRQPTPIMLSAIDLDRKGNAKRRGTRLMLVDTNHFKSWVHSHCAIPAGETGSWNLPYDCTDDFCDQITSESRVVKPNRSVVWLHSKHINNHWLDTEVLNSAAAHRLNVHLIPLSKSPTTAADPATGDSAPPGAPPTAPPSGSSQPRKIPNPMLHPGFGRAPGMAGANWMTSWRK